MSRYDSWGYAEYASADLLEMSRFWKENGGGVLGSEWHAIAAAIGIKKEKMTPRFLIQLLGNPYGFLGNREKEGALVYRFVFQWPGAADEEHEQYFFFKNGLLASSGHNAVGNNPDDWIRYDPKYHDEIWACPG